MRAAQATSSPVSRLMEVGPWDLSSQPGKDLHTLPAKKAVDSTVLQKKSKQALTQIHEKEQKEWE